MSDTELLPPSFQTKGRAPLIVELNGDVPKISRDTMDFDIDNDGRSENIRLLGPGSGFLALDKNKDGVINDSSELLGTGFIENGFESLSQYDLDQNGWIDENDEIFNELRVWENAGDGNMKLSNLKEAGLGAIYLKDSINNVDLWETKSGGKDTVKSSSVVLNENGRVSGIHALSIKGLNPRNLVDEIS